MTVRRSLVLAATVFASALLAAMAPASTAPRWSAPVQLSGIGENGDAVLWGLPVVAVDGQGRATAAWTFDDGDGEIVQSSTRAPGRPWSKPVTLSRPTHPPTAQLDVTLAVDQRGDAVLAWESDTDTAANVEVATRPAGAAWTKPTKISKIGGDDFAFPTAAIAPTGRAVVVWLVNRTSNIRVQAATHPAGGGWTAPSTISPVVDSPGDESGQSRDIGSPAVAFDGAGDATAIWSLPDELNGGFDIGSTSLNATATTWQAPIGVASLPKNASDNSGTPQIAFDPSGSAIAMWNNAPDEGAEQRVQSATLAPGAAQWSPVTTVSARGTASGDVRMVVDGTGDVTAVWVSGTTAFRVQASTRPPGGAFGRPVNLSLKGHDGAGASVAVDPGGAVYVAWESIGKDSTQIAGATRRTATSAWTAPVTIAHAGNLLGGEPMVAAGRAGEATAVWMHAPDDETFDIQSADYPRRP